MSRLFTELRSMEGEADLRDDRKFTWEKRVPWNDGVRVGCMNLLVKVQQILIMRWLRDLAMEMTFEEGWK